jgi:hypothetical protein
MDDFFAEGHVTSRVSNLLREIMGTYDFSVERGVTDTPGALGNYAAFRRYAQLIDELLQEFTESVDLSQLPMAENTASGDEAGLNTAESVAYELARLCAAVVDDAEVAGRYLCITYIAAGLDDDEFATLLDSTKAMTAWADNDEQE